MVVRFSTIKFKIVNTLYYMVVYKEKVIKLEKNEA